MTEDKGDYAFRGGVKGRPLEMTYAGALSFMRRRYSRDLEGVDVVVSGVPYDASVTNRPGCRFRTSSDPRGFDADIGVGFVSVGVQHFRASRHR